MGQEEKPVRLLADISQQVGGWRRAGGGRAESQSQPDRPPKAQATIFLTKCGRRH